MLFCDIPRVLFRSSPARWLLQRCPDRKALVGSLRHGRKISVCVLHPGQPAVSSSTHQGSSHSHPLCFFFALPSGLKTSSVSTRFRHPWKGPRAVFATVILRLPPPLSKRPGYQHSLPRTVAVRSAGTEQERGTSVCVVSWWYFHVLPTSLPCCSLPPSRPSPALSGRQTALLQRRSPLHTAAASTRSHCAGSLTLANPPELPTKITSKACCACVSFSACLPSFPPPTPAHFLSQPATRLDAVHHHLRAVRPAPSSSNLVPFNGSLGSFRLIADFVLHSSSALTP